MHLNHKVLNIIKSAVHPTPEGVGFPLYPCNYLKTIILPLKNFNKKSEANLHFPFLAYSHHESF